MHPYSKKSETLGKLRQGPLGPYLETFISQLRDEGYGVETTHRKLRLLAKFSSWLTKTRIPIEQIGDLHAEKFLAYYARRRYLQSSDPAALKRLLVILRQYRVTPNEVEKTKPTPAELMTEEFVNYLLNERGLTKSTAFHYQQFVKQFLNTRFADGAIGLTDLMSADIVSFVRIRSASLGHKRAKLMTCSLRSFLKFAYYKGFLQTEMEGAVPKVVGWSMSDVPKALPINHLTRILTLCDRSKPRDRRDFAILLLLSRLGLRAGEIVTLTLDDIDWELGSINISGKGGQSSELPLPTDVGEAISEYLQKDRPKTSSRSIFFTVKAPIVPLPRQESVGHIVARRLTKAGIDTPRKGAHQLRHSLATEMLRQGSTLDEIGELLRHHSSQSTMIYAKVDLVSLQKLALPWPGGVQ
ncbi:MAG: site-specific integrase [Nitrosomonas sp.]|nr:site-specific integrase [Nitrosomonas sp.]